MRTTDRIFGWLMVVAALLHCYGAIKVYDHQPELLLWSLGTGFAELLLAAMNLVRAERRHDLVLARLCVAGNVVWLTIVCSFAALIHSFFDTRVLIQFVLAISLLWFSVRARRRSRPM